ncbi:uncharacterized protein LOC116210083 [Punica granatum]|uniref:Uncharacterized protein LOC116210083 n=2 Tax=Punica granatum TaxID=22663 RepID=A0A6P8DZK1_PUNGR|nr:uncharacterized protein LOC116210083 [Punica granatum]PKI56219.1 hypothetical protein CRG98_023414 [Punica granatum]
MLSTASLPPFSLCNPTSARATTASRCTTSSSVVPSLHGVPRFPLSDSPSTTPPPRLSLSASPLLRSTHYRNGISAGAVKSRRKDRSNGALEMDGFDDDDGDEEDEDELCLPFGKMQQWLENKPRGFGVAKVYDTSIEDKLLEEMLQSRQAQAANINKLKNAPVNPAPKRDASQLKVTGESPSSIRVRVVNLPKKKNVHRDLKLAFDGTPGMLNIVPAVSGNQKTRDPVCKGFAFVDFKSEKDAVRFVETFSRRSITFGKVQKQIECEIENRRSSISADGESENELYAAASRPMDLDVEGEPAVSSVVDDSFSDSREDLTSEQEDDADGDFVEAEFEETYEDMESLTLSELNSSNSVDRGFISPSASVSSEQKSRMPVSVKKQGKSRVKRQKPSGKGNGVKVKVKVPKLGVPGSAKRLKIKEKAVLIGVFSKYGAKADFALNQES